MAMHVSQFPIIIKKWLGFNSAIFSACPKPGPWFPTPYVMLFFPPVFNDFNGEVVFHFVDIGGIVDHHCLNVLALLILVELLTITV